MSLWRRRRLVQGLSSLWWRMSGTWTRRMRIVWGIWIRMRGLIPFGGGILKAWMRRRGTWCWVRGFFFLPFPFGLPWLGNRLRMFRVRRLIYWRVWMEYRIGFRFRSPFPWLLNFTCPTGAPLPLRRLPVPVPVLVTNVRDRLMNILTNDQVECQENQHELAY